MPPPATEPADGEGAKRRGAVALRPLAEVARNGVGRVTPAMARANAAVRRNPKVAGGLDAASGAWWTLVDAFCDAIAPLLARIFPERRLIAVASDGGRTLTLHRAIDEHVESLGPLEALAPDVLAGLAAAHWSAIELRLPSEQVMRRSLQLPAASRDFVAPILDHRLERLTPWRPDKVLYGFSVADEGAGTGSLAVSLAATSRDLVATPTERLAAAGLGATALGSAEERFDAPLAINMLKGGSTGARDEARRWVSRAALATFAVLLLLVGASAWWAASASTEQTAVARDLRKARRLLRNATAGPLTAAEQALVDAKAPDRAVVVLVNRLAAAIPPDTYLREMTVSPDKVRLLGLSGDAPALVGDLEAAGLLNPRFTSSITREKSGKDSFEITADRTAPKTDDAP